MVCKPVVRDRRGGACWISVLTLVVRLSHQAQQLLFLVVLGHVREADLIVATSFGFMFASIRWTCLSWYVDL